MAAVSDAIGTETPPDGLLPGTARQLEPRPQWEWLAGRGQVARRVLVFGAGDAGYQLVRAVDAQPQRKLQILGVFDDRTATAEADRKALSGVDGTSDDLLRVAQERWIDEIILALPKDSDARLRQLVDKFCVLPASITAYEGSARGSIVDMVPSLRRRVLLRRQHDRAYRWIKPVIDLTLGALVMCLTLPLMLLIALAIKVDSPGPVLFRQQRYGFKGKVFWLYKFRTLRQECADPLGARQTQVDDERVTRIGTILRRTHLDELPQLLNVLKGEMSLVGPRPHPIGMRTEGRLCRELLHCYFSRYRVKPGMTGWAQVNGCRGPMRRAIQLRRRVDHDLYYVEHCSFLLDLRILLQTLLGFVGSKPLGAERFSTTGRGRTRSRRQHLAANVEELDPGGARGARDRASNLQPAPLDDGVQVG